MQNRDIFYDMLKGYAIILVVVGHAIQNLHPAGMENRVAMFIYAFHMPLFIAISGIFVIRAIDKRSFWEFIANRFFRLMLPSMSFGFLIGLLLFFNGYSDTGQLDFKLWAITCINGLWFLRVLFILSVVACILRKTLGNRMMIGWLVIILLLYFLPSTRFLNELKFLSPFFALSIFLASKSSYDARKLPYWLTVLCTLVFFILLPHYNFSKTMYSMNNDFHSLAYCKDFFLRLFIGLTGIILSAGLCKLISYFSKLKLLADNQNYIKLISIIASLGALSLPIYAIHERFFIVTHISKFHTESYIVLILVSALFILLSILCYRFLSKSHLLGLLLFGNPRKLQPDTTMLRQAN